MCLLTETRALSAQGEKRALVGNLTMPSDSLPPVGRGSGRRWPVAYPVPRATRRKKGLPGAWAVLFQRAVGSDPAGCASRRAHRVETAIAFRLHNALGTQNERYFVAVNPTAHSLACLRIGVFVTADAARLATGVGGSPFTGRVSYPLDGKQSGSIRVSQRYFGAFRGFP